MSKNAGLLAALKKRRDTIANATDANPTVPQSITNETKNPQKRKNDSITSNEVTTNKKQKNNNQKQSEIVPEQTTISKSKGTKTKGTTSTLQQLEVRLQGSRFRWLNEQLYTTTSDKAYEMMQENPKVFDEYHQGFRVQVEKWPKNPVDVFIQYLMKRPKLVVGDFGCGEAKLAASVKNKVHSFDLVAANKYITACDIRNVPLKKETLDVAIFSLALMGTNMIDFIKEAHRTLKVGGELKIAEVRSRFGEEEGGVERFIQAVVSIGFSFVSENRSNKMFVLLDFKKLKENTATDVSYENGSLLKPCIYKRR